MLKKKYEFLEEGANVDKTPTATDIRRQGCCRMRVRLCEARTIPRFYERLPWGNIISYIYNYNGYSDIIVGI